jgi:hypothetical protein
MIVFKDIVPHLEIKHLNKYLLFCTKRKYIILSKTLIIFSLVLDSILICYNPYFETLNFIDLSIEFIFPSQIHKIVKVIWIVSILDSA